MLGSGKYGVEWTVNSLDRENGRFRVIVFIVVLVALISLGWTLVSRHLRTAREEQSAETRISAENSKPAVEKSAYPDMPPPKPIDKSASANRPHKVRVLLQKLDEAQRCKDVEMEVSTIETLRSMPGSPVADLDDSLARRLGTLNFKRLFERHNRQWVKSVVVRSGQSASRIAAENGSTLASFSKLNGGNVERVFAGKEMLVMNHPRFQLVVHKRLMTADLMLNGKFFKRYDIVRKISGKDGAYEIPHPVRSLWNAIGVTFRESDRNEIEMMMPKGSPVILSEM